MQDTSGAEARVIMRLNGEQAAEVIPATVPCELTPSRWVEAGTTVTFETGSETLTHSLGELVGWAHFSLRVHANLTCQADCWITASEVYNPGDRGEGVRFQPFHLPGSESDPDSLRGRGLFERGLHFRGIATSGWIRLSCLCDDCRRSFHLRSYHMGFSDTAYMYSGSGGDTLLMEMDEVSAFDAGVKDPEALRRFEESLPRAPDGTTFRYLNPFRCPHCRAAYIDFEQFPEMRPGEYYGNNLFRAMPIWLRDSEWAPPG